ncbi:hypothetical protein SAMN05660199_04144 [Klenkia soli]|uniref:Uncharacterized protein n=1 Tax=Klenkia soli TaxID=1052260 RepID=A0A1H0TFG6_9ACTN|nr:hypothetical protein [Klenkia soli]SDP52767.1 hypothetical protein SAMN05660199_04144 [Klenkia soli]
MSGEPGAVPVPALEVLRTGATAAAAVQTLVGGGGLVVGVDGAGAPVVVTLFRPEPTAAVCLGGLGLVQRLVLRAMALGAAVTVESDRPSAWTALVGLAGGDGQVAVVPHDRGRLAPAGDEPPGTPGRPRLLVLDGDAAATGDTRRAGRWSAVLTCVDGTQEWGRAALASADVVVSRPLSRTEARQLGRVLNLDESALRSTGDDTLLLASRAGVVQVRHTATGVEQWLVGASTGRG